MLVQREVKSAKNIILILTIIVSLVVGGYLLYLNIGYYRGEARVSDQDLEIMNQAMAINLEVPAAASGNLWWKNLNINTKILSQTKVRELERLTAPLEIQDIRKGKEQIFKSILDEF